MIVHIYPDCRTMLLQAYYSTRADFGGVFQTTLYLPENSGISQPIAAQPQRNSKSSKNAAALEALKQLHAIGKLDDWLQPTWVSNRHSQQLGGWQVRGGCFTCNMCKRVSLMQSLRYRYLLICWWGQR